MTPMNRPHSALRVPPRSATRRAATLFSFILFSPILFSAVLFSAIVFSAIVFSSVAFSAGLLRAEPLWVEYEPSEGPGGGKHVVLVSGDEEYRSEEGLPQLARILAERHGFRCTVLFAIEPETGVINPDRRDNIPGLEALQDAELMIISTRFRTLPDEQMRHIVEYVESGRPIIGLRTATHAFEIPEDRRFARYSWNSSEWEGGFGRQVLGETWIRHHGNHSRQSTRGVVAKEQEGHPILRGISDGDIWGPTNVYGLRLPLPGDSQPLVFGQVLESMQPDAAAVDGPQNDPMMPIAWTRTYTGQSGETARVFATTMGASQDLLSEGLRRLLVNAVYWAVGLEDQIPEQADVELVGEYDPSPFAFDGYRRGVRPADHQRD